MSEETKLREEICLIAKSLFDRGLTYGASGNISARLSDGTVLMTPTGSSLGFLDPSRISHLDADFKLLSGDTPTKEIHLHTAFYETRERTGAVVHLHSTYSVALSMLPDINSDDALPALTPYTVMRVGKVKLLPFFLPGDAAMGDAVKGLAGRYAAVLLANHGPVVAGRDLWSAVFAMEELEETAKLAVLTRGLNPRMLTADEIRQLNAMS
ncbi:aldolase [Ruegeria sp. ANG-S4]|uniref:3-oxo-tetronate 4-phosphate decarboxylase n=1 Tax=Ruegeria sp. ANG-S4 TaxID=1577904 RepID=UPI00057DB5FB|nr:3-oxo-tetronate 4-phosphate decarboxylase [Ruegeria sp. ANG-S4]KIC46441.1 aldolase [Ruegeria sp. ANG-S4]